MSSHNRDLWQVWNGVLRSRQSCLSVLVQVYLWRVRPILCIVVFSTPDDGLKAAVLHRGKTPTIPADVMLQ